MQPDPPASPLLSAALAIAAAILGVLVVQLIARRILRTVRRLDTLPKERQQQLVTLIQTGRWVANVLIIGLGLAMLLSRFVDIAPLLAGAGVAGLAVSLGAQALIQDLIAGFLILLENQYNVGDVIQLGDVTGTVERMTLRVTHVRDLEGRLFIVPNGEVRIVANATKEWSRALIDVGIAYEEDIERVLGVLEEIAERFAAEPAHQLLEPPQVLGPIALGDWAVTLRVMVKTRPGQQWEVARALRKAILTTFEAQGIVMPYPRQEVLVQEEGFA